MLKNRKIVSGIALGLGMAFALTACGNGDTGNGATPAPGGDGEPGVPSTSLSIADAQRVGAMEDFELGTTFRATQPISIDLLYRVHPNFPVQDDWMIFSELAENQNVTFNRTDVLLADWDDRRSLLIQTGDMPTIVGNVWPGQQNAWMTGGALLAVSDYFDYMPNLSALIDEWDMGASLDQQRSDDGKIYMFPDFRQSPAVSWGYIVNTDLFEAAGWDIADIATFDDLGAALRDVQANTDVDFAYSDRWTDAVPLGGALNFVGGSFDAQGGWALSATRWNEAADEFIANPMSDNYRDMIEFFAGLVADGAMTPDITQSDDQAIESFLNGRSAMISGNPGALQELRTAAAEAGLPLNASMLVLPNASHDILPGGRLGPGMVLRSDIVDSPYFLATLQFIDWFLYSPEGREFNFWGVEGVTFERAADGTRSYIGNIVGMGRDAIAEGIDEADIDDIVINYGFQDGFWGYPGSGSDELVQSLLSPEQAAWVNATLAIKSFEPIAPAAPLNELEQEEMSILTTAINDYVHGETARFVSGARPMSEWEDFRAELRNLNIDRVLEIQNGALARARG